METLSCLLNRAIGGNYLSGSRFTDESGEELVISNLLYADDTLLFCKADNDELKFISWILMWFEAVSSLKINLNKSEILPFGPVANMEASLRAWMQSWIPSHDLPGPPSRCQTQSTKCLGFGRRKISEEIGILEAAVHFKRRKSHTHLKFLV